MPVCTWLDKAAQEKYKTVDDEEVNELLQEVRQQDSRWYVQEVQVKSRKHWFSKWQTKPWYVMYVDYAGDGREFQIVNFGHHNKSEVMAYLYGFLAGTQSQRFKALDNAARV